jgi:hypothetical protein
MNMTKASNAQVTWDSGKKVWLVRIQIGAEVVKRPAADAGRDVAEETLRSTAVQIAQDEGYELDPAKVVINR